jgi:hypothetical protein
VTLSGGRHRIDGVVCTGLAWAPSGREIWVSENLGAGQSAVSAITTSGERRVIWRGPGSVSLQDVNAAGQAIVRIASVQGGVMASTPTGEADVSWLDQSRAVAITRDGTALVLNEAGGGGSGATFYLRPLDGSPAVKLGQGRALDISSDGRTVLSAADPFRYVLTPVGAGALREIHHPSAWSVFAWFMPDGERLLMNGRTGTGDRWRYYVVPLAGGDPQPILQEGLDNFIGQHPMSPDGRLIAGIMQPGVGVRVYTLDGHEIPVRGLIAGDVVIQFTADSRELYVFNRDGLPARVFRVDFRTGQRTLWRQFVPADSAGVAGIDSFVMTPDARAYAYNYIRHLSDLYLIEGLR